MPGLSGQKMASTQKGQIIRMIKLIPCVPINCTKRKAHKTV